VSSIQQALGHLFDSLERLETTAVRQEQKPARGRKLEQQDLFSGIASAFAVDPALVARKLDGAIEKIEKILREG
jgi:hypothetical protein